ncbi:MAG: AzlC family ABC transporter permease [Gammaproteobacteria bacterium]|nr:AzlC family ABC transporter permease [Gammaproteobacteria bacterium]
MPQSKSDYFFLGVRDTVPLIIAAVPFGLVFGALAQANGLSAAATMGMSAFVFAGSSQFIAATLLGSAAALPIIVLTVFIVNLRHMLYSASLMPHVGQIPSPLRLLMSFWLTDETFATVSNRLLHDDNPQNLPAYYFGSAIAMYSNWQLCTWIGIVMGQRVPDLTSWGLDIAMVVAFIGIVVPVLQNRAQWACAATAFFAALITHAWPHQSGLLFSSLLAILVGVLLARRSRKSS